MKRTLDASSAIKLYDLAFNGEDEELEKVCDDIKIKIKNAVYNNDMDGLKYVYNKYLGDVTKYNGDFLTSTDKGDFPTVPSDWTTVNLTYLPIVITEYAGRQQDSRLDSIFPIGPALTRRRVTSLKTWNRALLDKTKPGVPGSAYDYVVKKWASQNDFFGKAIETSVWHMENSDDVREVVTQISMYLQSKIDSFFVMIFTALKNMSDPIIERLRFNRPDSEIVKIMLEKYMGDWNCIINKHPLADLELNKIKGCEYVGSTPDTLIITNVTSNIIRSKDENTLYYLNGDIDNGTGLTRFTTRPDTEIIRIGTTPVLIVEDINCRKFIFRPLVNTVLVGERAISHPVNIDKLNNDFGSDEMSLWIGDYTKKGEELTELKLEDLYNAANPFTGNELDVIDGEDFLSYGDDGDKKAIIFFGDMVNDKKKGCTTKYFAKLANTLRLRALKSMGYTFEDEIRLLSRASKLRATWIEKAGNSYDGLRIWAYDKTIVNFGEEQKIAKEYVEYLDGLATFLFKIYGEGGNLLFDKGEDAVEDINSRWISRTFFNGDLTVKNGYAIETKNISSFTEDKFIETNFTEQIVEHIKRISEYAEINTSLGPMLLTYLFSAFENDVIVNMIKNNVLPPFAVQVMRMMEIDTENALWVKSGVTMLREEGMTSTLKEGSMQGFMRWSINSNLGVYSNGLDEIYKAQNIRMKEFRRGCGSVLVNMKNWNKGQFRYNEEDFLKSISSDDNKNGSLFAMLIPPELTNSDFKDHRYSFKGTDIITGEDKTMPGYARYVQYFDSKGKFEKWTPEDCEINYLWFTMCSKKMKDGKHIKQTGELFNYIDNECLKQLIGNNYTDKL